MGYIELISGLIFLAIPLSLAVVITAIAEYRERKREKAVEKRAIKRIKDEQRRKAA